MPSANDTLPSGITDSIFHGYTPQAKAFWWVVVVLGSLALLHSMDRLADSPWEDQWVIAIGLGLVVLSAAFPLPLSRLADILPRPGEATRFPSYGKQGARLNYSFGDFYTFLLLFTYGPYAAALACALDGFICARASTTRWSSRIVAPAITVLVMYVGGRLLVSMMPASSGEALGATVVGGMLFAAGIFLTQTLLMLVIPLLKQGSRLTPGAVLGNFGAAGVATMVTAGFAALLAATFRNELPMLMLYSAPLLATIIMLMQAFSRQHRAYVLAREEVEASLRRETEVVQEGMRNLRASERRFQALFTDAPVGMAVLSRDGFIQQSNAALNALLRSTEGALASRDFGAFVADPDSQLWQRHIRRTQRSDFQQFSVELRCRRGNAPELWVSVHCAAFVDPATGTPGLILHAQDTTSQHEAKLALDHLAHHDSLTGLPNRRRFSELLSRAVARAQRNGADGYALLFIDFDGFKGINDRLGHDAGDEFLVEMAKRLTNSLRPGDVAARLGGDEFAALLGLRMPEDLELARTVAERIVASLAVPYLLRGQSMSGRASIGVVNSARGYEREEDALRDADMAMYEAKAGSRGHIVVR